MWQTSGRIYLFLLLIGMNANRWRKEYIEINLTVWQTFKPGSRDHKIFNWKLFREYILKLISDRCNCVLSFDYCRFSHFASRKSRTPLIRQDAHCTFENCCEFKFTVEKSQDFKSNVIMELQQRCEENHDGQSRRFRNTNDDEKISIETLLEKERPSRVYDELLEKAEYEKLKAGNYNLPKSPAVIRKLKSLISASEHFHANVCVELDIIHRLFRECDEEKCLKGYIQRRGSDPFFSFLYMEEQLNLLKNTHSVVHFDATGSIFKKWKGIDKRILLYSIVLPNEREGEPPVAISEMISSDHNTEMITHFLFTLKMDMGRLKLKSPIKLFVVDFNWALIHSVLQSFSNGMNIEQYLVSSFNSVVSGSQFGCSTGVFICANHAIHIVSRKFAKTKNADKDKVAAFKQCFVLLQYTQQIEEFEEILILIFAMFGSEYVTEQVQEAKELIKKKLEKWNINKMNTDDVGTFSEMRELEENNIFKTSKGIRKNSPWLRFFKKIFDEKKQKYDESENANPYYSPELISYLINHWLSLFPLWCFAILNLFDLDKSKCWYSNAHVEGWFASVKATHLKKSSVGARVTIPKFIQTQRKFIKQRLIRFTLDSSRPSNKRKQKDNDDMSAHVAEEEWGKKRRARYVKPTKRNIQKMFTALKTDDIVPGRSDDIDITRGVNVELEDEENSMDSCDSSGQISDVIALNESDNDSNGTQNNQCHYNSDSSSTSIYEFIPPAHNFQEKQCSNKNDSPNETEKEIYISDEESLKSNNISETNDASELDVERIHANSNDNSQPKISQYFKQVEKSNINENSNRNIAEPTRKKFKPKVQDRRYRLQFMLRNGLCLTEFDTDTLQGNNWLDMNVVVGYLSCIETDKFVTWSNVDWNVLRTGEKPIEAVARTNWKKVHYIYIPICENSHFFGIVIDLLQKTVSCLDSMGSGERKLRHLTVVWNGFVRRNLKAYLNVGDFKSRHIQCPLQRDTHSCGVLVCMFGRMLCLDGNLMEVKTDAATMINARQEIFETLVANKDSERCCACRKHNDPFNKSGVLDKWIECGICGNSFHFGCARKEYNATDEEMEVLIWKCNYCRNC